MRRRASGLLGLYANPHNTAKFDNSIAKTICTPLGEVSPTKGATCWVRGQILTARLPGSQVVAKFEPNSVSTHS